MKKTKQIGSAACLIIILCLVAAPNIAKADLKDILLRFQPYVDVQEEYNNNIDLTDANKKDDFITTVYAGLKLTPLLKSTITGEIQQTPSAIDKKYGIDLDYRIGLVFYAKETDKNFISHAGTFNGWYSFTRNLTFRAREYLIRSDEPRETDYAPGALPGQYLLGTERKRDIYFRNVFEPSVEYRFGRENLISINYRNNFYKPQNPQSEDSQENFINPRLAYWFDIRNGILIDYSFSYGDFQRSPDFTSHLISTRYTLRFSPKTSISGEYYFERRDFKSSRFSTASSIDYDVQRPSFIIQHSFTPTLSGGAQLGYFWQDAERGSKTRNPFFVIDLRQREERTTYALSFQGGYTENFFTSENKGFTQYYRAIGTVAHQLKERMTIGGHITFEYVDSKPNGVDRIWGIGGNASYQMLKWLTLSVETSYRENNSNISNRDYSEFRGLIRATATYLR